MPVVRMPRSVMGVTDEEEEKRRKDSVVSRFMGGELPNKSFVLRYHNAHTLSFPNKKSSFVLGTVHQNNDLVVPRQEAWIPESGKADRGRPPTTRTRDFVASMGGLRAGLPWGI
jgi:hypothetical protein